MMLMLRAIALRNKPSKRLPDQFPGCVSQHPVHGGIRERNPPVAVDHDHGIPENVEQIGNVAETAGHGLPGEQRVGSVMLCGSCLRAGASPLTNIKFKCCRRRHP